MLHSEQCGLVLWPNLSSLCSVNKAAGRERSGKSGALMTRCGPLMITLALHYLCDVVVIMHTSMATVMEFFRGAVEIQ